MNRTWVAAASVVTANLALLVLELVVPRLMAPLAGQSLETWTGVIATFLAGIALGNWLGGKWADRGASSTSLALALACGALASLSLAGLSALLTAWPIHRGIPIGARILALTAAMGLPAGVTLSVVTPVAIRLVLSDVRRSGRIAGWAFALGTIGALLGNYLTGFVLIERFRLDSILFGVAGWLFAMAGLVAMSRQRTSAAWEVRQESVDHRWGWLALVFGASFCGMTLEMSGVRLLAPYIGASLYTWTGIIGAMLAATACGNWLGGRVARQDGRARLGLSLLVASLSILAVFILIRLLSTSEALPASRANAFAWTLVLFFVPMCALGTVSPQVIALTVPDLAHAGRTAGRVYAVSTLGAVVGTLMTGYILISHLGVYRILLILCGLLAVLGFLAGRLWRGTIGLLAIGTAAGAVTLGVPLVDAITARFDRETNYFSIRVEERTADGHTYRTLYLDRLAHSTVKVGDPGYLGYTHEHVQAELAHLLTAERGAIDVLVIGGGGYTFPRYLESRIPSADVDVVEIDPGVTATAHDRLGLPRGTSIGIHHMDGRRFVDEVAEPGQYDLITLDAVNDFTVPHHLLTREFNASVGRALSSEGVYLVSVIDRLDGGRLWPAVARTLEERFADVRLLAPRDAWMKPDRAVLVIQASDRRRDLGRLGEVLERQGIGEVWTERMPDDRFEEILTREPGLVLTDQHAPVDALLRDVILR